MAKEIKRVNIKEASELRLLVEEVRKDNRVIVLTSEGEELARITPPRARTSRRKITPKAMEAFLSAAGSWKDVDVDKFLANNQESKKLSTSGCIEL